MSPIEEPRYRRIIYDDLDTCHALTSRLGWSHRREDWQLLLDLGRGYVALSSSAAVGAALWWPFEPDSGSVGMVVVDPERQGQGIGSRLMDMILNDTGGRDLTLNATPVGIPLYEKLGFVAKGRIRQFQGKIIDALEPRFARNEQIRDGSGVDLKLLASLDRAATGLARNALLARLRADAQCVVLERNATLVGFSMLRQFGIGQVIGPVIAEDIDAARSLIGHWLYGRRGQYMRVDLIEEAGLAPWLVSSGLDEAAGATVMTRGMQSIPHGPAKRYALVSQALG